MQKFTTKILFLLLVSLISSSFAKPLDYPSYLSPVKRSADKSEEFSANESDKSEEGYDFYESFDKKDGDKYSEESHDDGEDEEGGKQSDYKKPLSYYTKQDEDDGSKGYLKRDSKKGDKGYKKFKTFANKHGDDYNFEKHEGFSHRDSQSKKGDIESEPVKEFHHYEVTEKTNWDAVKGGDGQKSGYSVFPGGFESYTNHNEEDFGGSKGSSDEKSEDHSGGDDDSEDNGDEKSSYEAEEDGDEEEEDDHGSYEK